MSDSTARAVVHLQVSEHVLHAIEKVREHRLDCVYPLDESSSRRSWPLNAALIGWSGSSTLTVTTWPSFQWNLKMPPMRAPRGRAGRLHSDRPGPGAPWPGWAALLIGNGGGVDAGQALAAAHEVEKRLADLPLIARPGRAGSLGRTARPRTGFATPSSLRTRRRISARKTYRGSSTTTTVSTRRSRFATSTTISTMRGRRSGTTDGSLSGFRAWSSRPACSAPARAGGASRHRGSRRRAVDLHRGEAALRARLSLRGRGRTRAQRAQRAASARARQGRPTRPGSS
jgi:hypothetical protein